MGEEQIQLSRVIEKIRSSYQVTPQLIKEGLMFDVSQIGIATTFSEMLTLFTALSMQEQRQKRALTMDNPAVIIFRQGLLANQQAMDTHHANITAWIAQEAAMQALPVPLHAPPVADLVLFYPAPLANQSLGRYNRACEYFQRGIVPAQPARFVYLLVQVRRNHQPHV